MKRITLLVLLCIITLSALANHSTIQADEYNIRNDLKRIYQIIQSKEWIATDSTIEPQLLALIHYLENPPLDSVVASLDLTLDNKEILFARNYQKIKNPEQVKGYVSQYEITRMLKEIADKITLEQLNTQLPVPEDQYTAGFASLDLINEDEVERMIDDSIYTFPDSIMALLSSPATEDNELLRCHLDSICSQMLNDAREAYNESLVQSFRDSITQQYHDNYVQTLIKNNQNSYLDSVYKVNNIILARYNDSETLRLNKELKEALLELVEHAKKIPNELNIVDLQNKKTTYNLRNNEGWYQWMWLKNSQNDSIGIRIENLGKHSVKMLVDETVNLSRLTFKDGLEVGRITPMENKELTLSKFVTRKPVLSPWKLVGKAYAGFTQNYINQFWSQGGISSASALATFNYAANYAKNKVIWESYADLKLGVIYYLPEDSVDNQRNWHKNSDNFELNTRFGLSAVKKWYYSVEANFKTQSFYGFSSLTDTVPSSALLSPAYLTFSAGMEYKPNKDFSAFLSPVSLKTTYVTNPLVDETNFGLVEGKTNKSRIGISGKLDYSHNLIENVSLKTKNSVFINFGNNNDGEWQFLKLPDFDSETSVDFKVNQFITTQVNCHFIYDKDVESTWASTSGETITGTRLQVKEFFTLGISYKF